MQRIDTNNTDIKASEIIAFSCVRNEILRLPYFLEYHRKLGVERFIFVDNDSTDGTREYLLEQSDNLVFYTNESYASSRCGIEWINTLIAEYGVDHWIVTLEPDELLTYPESEHVNLQQLTSYLDSIDAQAMRTFLVDMYSDKAIKDTCYIAGENFLDHCNYFDSDSYFAYNDANVPTRGGPRDRLFWQGFNREKNSPYLINIPIIKWRSDLQYKVGTHTIDNIKIAPIIGVKQHFKFFSDFYTYAEEEAVRNEHWDNAAQYKTYWDVLEKDKSLCGLYEGSLPYVDTCQLLDLGFMKATDDYLEFAQQCLVDDSDN